MLLFVGAGGVGKLTKSSEVGLVFLSFRFSSSFVSLPFQIPKFNLATKKYDYFVNALLSLAMFHRYLSVITEHYCGLSVVEINLSGV